MNARFCELRGTALIEFSGEDAVSFLHAQLTSDVAALGALRTQYSGYCSPKGRLLATCLLWRRNDNVLLQLPVALREVLQARLSRYVLRARVKIADASQRYRLFGLSAEEATTPLGAAGLQAPIADDDVHCADGACVTRLAAARYLALVPDGRVDSVREGLMAHARYDDERLWRRLDIAAGVPVILPETQDRYVPQMVNLDLVGGVSYTKGCYPGQEIVARTHYLGRVKQRAYRVSVTSAQPIRPGDPLFSAPFGGDQACGAILQAEPFDGADYDALAVIQTESVRRATVHWQSLDGPVVRVMSLPYTVPG